MVERTFPAPPRIDGLTDWRILAGGGFATVFAARPEDGGAELAVKCPHEPNDARFHRELEVLVALGPPVAPRLVRAGRSLDGRPFAIMELVPGDTLAGLLARRGGALPSDETVAIVDRLAAAVDALHVAGFVHRDLTPSNVFDRGTHATLIDFGLARGLRAPRDAAAPVDAALTAAGARLGTVLYMAPEQCRDAAAAGIPADLYALGVIAFELLTGTPPFGGDPGLVEHAHLTAPPPSLRIGEVDAVFARALAKEPASRFPSAGALARALRDALQRARATAPHPAGATLSVGATDRRPTAIALLRTSASAPEIRALLDRVGAQVVRGPGDPLLVAFPELGAGAGVRAAMALVRELGPRALQADLHVAELAVRRRRRGVLISGAAIDAIEQWAMPHERDEDRVLLTPEAARHAALGTVVAAPGDRTYRPTPAAWSSTAIAPAALPLRGRDGAIAAALAIARASLAPGSAQPGVVALVGAPGMGKTRMLEELHGALRGEPCEVIRIAARAPGAADGRELRAELLAQLGDPMPTAPPDRPAASPAADRDAIATAIATALHARAAARPVAVLLDDAHWADFGVLDGLERAALAEQGSSIWICAAADPQLLELRPAWGARAGLSELIELPPLDTEASNALLADLLHPVDYLPRDVAMSLVQITHGNPLESVQLATALRAAGALRRRPGTESWFLAVDELPQVASTPLAAQLADRLVRDLPAPLARVLELCAVAAQPVTADAIARVQAAVGQRDVDAGAALGALARAGALATDASGAYRLRRPTLVGAIEARMERGARAAAHAAFLHVLDEAPSIDRARIARHAAACGHQARAASLCLALGDEARTAFRYAAADAWYSQALDQLGGDRAELELLALRGRATVRYLSERPAESLADLERAGALADELGDRRAAVELALERATALDWLARHAESADAADHAIRALGDLDDPRLRARCAMAAARTLLRQQRWDQGVEACAAAAQLAAAADDAETEIIALQLMAGGCVFSDQLDRAERMFERAEQVCLASGDRAHLGMLYGNRTLLWGRRKDLASAIADGRRAMAVAREIGQSFLEHQADHNLAELLFWTGELDEAIVLADRARELNRRLRQVPRPESALLAARIRAARGELDEACALARWTREACDPRELIGSHAVLLELIDVRCAEPPADAAAWAALLDRAGDALTTDEHLEVLHACLQACAARGWTALRDEVARTAAGLAADSPSWQQQLAAAGARA